jgi:hypothetical protein
MLIGYARVSTQERLVEAFSEVPDPRCTGKVVHRLFDIVVIAVCAVIAGAWTTRPTTFWH